MRHRQKKAKLGRTPDHRDAMLANLACSLIEHERICTTLARAKALRPFAEKMVTLAKRGDLHSRRLAISRLRAQPHWKKVKMGKRVDHVAKLFDQIAPACEERQGGYTRILKLPRRYEDSAQMAYIEWVDRPGEAPEVEVVDEKETAAAAAKA